MSTKNNYISNFDDIINRLRQLSGKSKQYEIAGLLGFDKDTFAARKSRGSVPEKEIKITCASNAWSFEWVMTGEGNMTIQPDPYPKGVQNFTDTAIQAETLSKEKELEYGVTRVIQDLTPAEAEMIRIARESPEAMAVVRMMGAVDSDTKKDIQRGAEKEKLMYDLMKERQGKNAA